MADITITAANVVTTSSSKKTGTAGASITAGQALYEDTADSNKLKLAVSSSSAAAACAGIALHAAASGQPITYQTSGDITIGGTVAVGECYFVSGSAGGLQPRADLGTNEYTTLVGVGKSTSVVTINIVQTGAQAA